MLDKAPHVSGRIPKEIADLMGNGMLAESYCEMIYAK